MISAPSTGGGRPDAYRAADGRRVPSVTKVLGAYHADALIHWAWRLGRKGADYRTLRDDAGAVGHIAHGWIEDSLHGRELREASGRDELLQKAGAAHRAFITWRDQVGLEVLDTETPLVSEEHRYGGTYDAIGVIADAVLLLDWKSGRRVYAEHVAQLAAYRQLVRENTFHDPAGARVLRISDAGFSDYPLSPELLDLGWSRFLLTKKLFDLDTTLQKGLKR